MPKESTIQHYTSSTTGNTPAAVDLASGELAINTADEKVFYKNHNGVVLSLSQTKDLSGAFASKSAVVTSFNGTTGAVGFTIPLATTSVTGVANFNSTYFTVNSNGRVDLANGYDVLRTAGSFINIAANGSIHNIGVRTLNGFTGAVQVTGSGAVLHSVSGTTTTLDARLSSTSVTGVASFNNVHFTVDTTGHVQLASAYQATGDTVITVAGSGIGIVTSDKTDTLYNIGVTSFNGLTGNITLTGDGGSSLVRGNNTITNRLSSTSVTGVASFRNTHFTVDTTGHVQLASAYQVTGQTVVSGGASQLVSTSGNTVTIDNRVATSSVTGVASFNNQSFIVGTTGHVRLNGLLGSGAVPFSTALGDGLTTSSAFQFDISNNKLTVANATSPSRNFSLEASSTIAYLTANGAVDFVIGHAAGNPITIGDYDGVMFSTKVVVDTNNDLINLFSTNNPITLDSPGLTVSNWLSVGGGATFNGNVTLGNAATDTTTIYGTKIVNEGVYANGSLRTANINFANGQVQTLTGVGTGATGTTAIYFTGAPSTGAASVTMIITNGGSMTGAGMTAWGGNIKWPNGIKPVLTSNGVDVVSFVTPDAGATIYGFVGGLNFT